MTFFEFESKEIIDENCYAKLIVEPVGTKYKYTLRFEDENGHVQFGGTTTTPILALLKLKNLLIATMDTLADCVEITKSAAGQVDFFENMNNDVSNDEEQEDEDDEFV